MKFFCFCRKKYCDKDSDPVHPKMQENVDAVVQPCDGKWNANSAGIIESEGSQSAVKIARFELDVTTSNVWDFPSSIVKYLNKYMNILIQYKDIKEKNLKEHRTIQSLPVSGSPGS